MKAAVLGSGIAGLTVAEMLSRNGWHVSVRDVNPFLGGDASLATQNWHHTGWLYAGMPNDSPLKGCATALDLLPELYPGGRERWIRPRDILFAYAIRGHELNLGHRIAWQGYVSTVILPRMRHLGLLGERIDPPAALAELMDLWENSADARDRYWTYRSTDAELDTRAVLTWLAAGITGEAVLGVKPRISPMKEWTYVDGDSYDLVVLASGSGLQEQLISVGRVDLAAKVTSVVSPVVVLDAPLELPNFIRYTPVLDWTVNHMRFWTDAGEVSTIGGYDYWPVTEMRPPEPFAEKVCGFLGIPSSRAAHTYYATKTEYTDGRDRRYNHAVVRVNRNTLLVVPGKFSQFPLLASDFARAARLDDTAPSVRARGLGPIGQLRALAGVPV